MATDIDAWAQAGLIYELSESVAWMRLNRPQRRNAMDHYPGGEGPDGMGLRDALLEAIRQATEDKTVKVAVITGKGSVFSAGADLKSEALEIPAERRRSPTVARDDGLLYGWYRLLESIWRSETPFIAAVNGRFTRPTGRHVSAGRTSSASTRLVATDPGGVRAELLPSLGRAQLGYVKPNNRASTVPRAVQFDYGAALVGASIP